MLIKFFFHVNSDAEKKRAVDSQQEKFREIAICYQWEKFISSLAAAAPYSKYRPNSDVTER